MAKNLILLRDGFPGSSTSGTAIETLDLKNFFKYEKNVIPTTYARKTYDLGGYKDIANYPNDHVKFTEWFRDPQYFEKDTGEYAPNTLFKHYSASAMLFAVRMENGYSGTDITITSRIEKDNLKIRFMDIGKSVDDFKDLYNELPARTWHVTRGATYGRGYRCLVDTIVIPTLENLNHCFLAVVFSDSAYELETGSVLLNNEPLLNISWTETKFLEAQ